MERPRHVGKLRSLLDNSDLLLAISGVLSIATVGAHVLALNVSLGSQRYYDYFDILCVFWAMSVGAVLCAARAWWLLHRRHHEDELPRPLLGPVIAELLIGLGGLIALSESFFLYLSSLPKRY
jgi:hypothetical protein